MYEDALRRRMAHEARLPLALGEGERPELSVTAMCLDLGAGSDNEGYLTLTNRRILFYRDAAEPLSPPGPVIDLAAVSSVESQRGPMKTALAIIYVFKGRAVALRHWSKVGARPEEGHNEDEMMEP
jgi:hypothetical protein